MDKIRQHRRLVGQIWEFGRSFTKDPDGKDTTQITFLYKISTKGIYTMFRNSEVSFLSFVGVVVCCCTG